MLKNKLCRNYETIEAFWLKRFFFNDCWSVTRWAKFYTLYLIFIIYPYIILGNSFILMAYFYKSVRFLINLGKNEILNRIKTFNHIFFSFFPENNEWKFLNIIEIWNIKYCFQCLHFYFSVFLVHVKHVSSSGP